MAINPDPRFPDVDRSIESVERRADEMIRPTYGSSPAVIFVLVLAAALAAWYFYGRVTPTVDTTTGPAVTGPATTPSTTPTQPPVVPAAPTEPSTAPPASTP
jgi:hypothetical protein